MADHDSQAENAPVVEAIVNDAQQQLKHFSRELDILLETMQRAAILHEQALLARNAGRLLELVHYSREAVKLVPIWNSPHNNQAYGLYFTGKMAEAIAVIESVMKCMLYSENTNMVALEILDKLNTPEINAEIQRFAFSQGGSIESKTDPRVLALIEKVTKANSGQEAIGAPGRPHLRHGFLQSRRRDGAGRAG